MINLDEKMAVLGRMSGTIAHDVNNFLQVLEYGLSSLREDIAETDPRMEDVTDMAEALKRAGEMMTNLMAFGQRQSCSPVSIRVGDFIHNWSHRSDWPMDDQVDIRMDFAKDLPNLRIDPAGMDIAFSAVLKNALESMPHGGRLTISGGLSTLTDEQKSTFNISAPQLLAISFKDGGMGIPATDLERIFEPFYTTKAKLVRGQGMGLSIAYGIARQQGGTITLESKEGDGTTVTFHLPADVVSAAAPIPRSGGGAPSSLAVLFVEDDPGIRRIMPKFLKAKGFVVYTAANGLEALDVLERAPEPISIVISDVLMPEMGGVELYKAEAMRPLRDRFILMTGYSDVLDSLRDEDGNFPVPLLRKPVMAQALLDKVSEMLDLPL